MKISEVQIGMKLNHPRYGEGMVTNRTARTVSATFSNGMRCKVTYKTSDTNFFVTDF